MSDKKIEIQKKLRVFLEQNFLGASLAAKLGEEDSFLKKGIIDSMGVIELVQYVQSEFDVKVESRDITPDNFDSMKKIEMYVLRKAKYDT